jgi:small subunit ribosomal protein S1
VLQVNQEVKVKVLDIDRDRQRISLGLKQTQEDPWQRIVAEHRIGDVVEGRVTKIVAFGAFVEIYEGIEGLVHISELANRHVERPDEVVSVSQQVLVKVIEIDSDRRRLSLSIKRVEGQQVEPLIKLEPEVSEEDEALVTEVVEEAVVEEAVAEEIAEVVAEDVVVEAVEEAVAADAEAEEDAPTLGLSDEVFPAGSDAGADEAEAPAADASDEAAAPAEADDASETPGEPGSGS